MLFLVSCGKENGDYTLDAKSVNLLLQIGHDENQPVASLRHTLFMVAAMQAVPKPLPILTTTMPGAQMLRSASKAVIPPDATPYSTLAGTAIPGLSIYPATPLNRALFMPACNDEDSRRPVLSMLILSGKHLLNVQRCCIPTSSFLQCQTFCNNSADFGCNFSASNRALQNQQITGGIPAGRVFFTRPIILILNIL
jgi:hypothetical protein